MPASHTPLLEDTLKDASRNETRCEWGKATLLYQKALDSVDPEESPLETARITELLAKSHFREAFQSESREEFRRWMNLAEASYQRAATFYERTGDYGLSKRAEARGLYATFWLRDETAGRREIAAKCIELARGAGDIFEGRGNKKHQAENHYDLFTYLREALNFATTRNLLIDLFRAAEEAGWNAIRRFEELGENEAMLESLHTMVLLFTWADYVLEPAEYEKFQKKIEELRAKAAEVAGKIATPYALFLAGEIASFLIGDLDGDTIKALASFEAEISKAEKTNDSYVIGRLLTGASSFARWMGLGEEYEEGRRQLLERSLGYASNAIRSLEIGRHGAWLKLAYGRYVGVSAHLALVVETDPERKRDRLRKAIETAGKGMVYEDHGWVSGVGHELSKAMYFLARMEEKADEKRKILSEALLVREETVRVHGQLSPHSWALGVMLNYLAIVKAELSSAEDDRIAKTELLQDAVSDMQRSLEQCSRWAESGPAATDPDLIYALANYKESHGDILTQLHRLTSQIDTAQQAIKAWEDAIAHFTKSGHIAPIPPLRWKMARAYDRTGDYQRALESFKKASDDYNVIAKKNPGLAPLFEDLASYMKTWSLIEEARIGHGKEDYSAAAERYSRAAERLNETSGWKHLSSHYNGCSLLEQGEYIARQEQQVDAIALFTEAAEAFNQAKIRIHEKLNATHDPQEKQELDDWQKITAVRLAYCNGRVELEEAKSLDKDGYHDASAERYRTASKVFGGLLGDVPDDRTRREIETLKLFCEAWAKMKEGEVEVAPEHYATAADSFSKASSITPDRRSRLLALANAHMCRALEAGTRFRLTQEPVLYGEIKRQMQTASEYYQKGDFKNAADWTRATQKLFDAKTYLNQAEIEVNPAKKTELYLLAESHLKLAAGLYEEAGFLGERREALRNLQLAREGSQTMSFPIKALEESPIEKTSPGPIGLTEDDPKGADRFEEAALGGTLKVPRQDVTLGSELVFDLWVTNLGKTSATLIKLEGIVPGGFKLDRSKVPHHIQDGFINLKGKRLEFDKHHELKVALKAVRRGEFALNPRIVFIDEKGNYRTHEFEQVKLKVQ